MSKNIEFDVHVKIKESQLPAFVSLLKRLELNGNIGHSELIGIYSDGDGEFRPKFTYKGLNINEIDDCKSTEAVYTRTYEYDCINHTTIKKDNERIIESLRGFELYDNG